MPKEANQPVTDKHPEPATSVFPREPLAGKTVLLVEDERYIADLLVNWLGVLGAHTLLAHSGGEGLKILAENPGRVCVVIADIRLPDMSGDDMCVQLRALHPRLPVLLSSGRYQREAEETLIRTGPTGFIQKPYPLKDVLGELLKLLAAA